MQGVVLTAVVELSANSRAGGPDMRFHTQRHRYYCGIDPRARAISVCVLDAAGDKLVHRNIPARREPLLKLSELYRPDARLPAH